MPSGTSPQSGHDREHSKPTNATLRAPQGWRWANEAATVLECSHCGYVARGNTDRHSHDCEGA